MFYSCYKIDDDSDRAQLTSFGTQFQTDEKQKETGNHQVLPFCVQL